MFVLKEASHYRFPNTKNHVYWCPTCRQPNSPQPGALTSLHKLAFMWFGREVKTAAADPDEMVQCYTCDSRLWMHASELHAGHAEGGMQKTPAYYDERWCHGQCQACNGFPGMGNYAAYHAHLVRDYGPTILDELAADKARVIKGGWGMTQDQIREVISQYEPPDAFEILADPFYGVDWGVFKPMVRTPTPQGIH
jgi:hypothetical protein